MTSLDPRQVIYRLALFAASVLFLLGLRGLTRPERARQGMRLGALGMLVGVVGTLFHRDIIEYQWIIGGGVLGALIGIPMGRWIPMTKMPERIALSHAFGGLAVATVGVAEFLHAGSAMSRFGTGVVSFELLMGALTFTGSLMAFGKLQGILPGKPITFPGNQWLNAALCAFAVLALGHLVYQPGQLDAFMLVAGAGLLLGMLLVLPIGGADMPVVICLLNAYAGLAAAASGFVFDNAALIICGALDGGSGLILALLMSKAMNRSFGNVLFGAFGSAELASGGAGAQPGVREASVEDTAELLKLANSVVFVPGYGMAVGQAQHAVRELAGALEQIGTRVKYAIHPVAGRMPGHMNVLLAEANVPYDQLYELDAINGEFAHTDVAVVVGANDVVNPAAKTSPKSPIFGMPVLNVDAAKAIIVLKRGMNPGFSGIENELFALPQTLMLFGDAKASLTKLCSAIKGAVH
ncbi:MAG TPA: NAD(P)(+) transhydrogenase (Re/Si-specific) subunit beta [Polyangiaceae bacterium]|nr:NAD(P)(+) transhydrogenase (Re/Si-specific) subunit beta [Polyangiaceae bacterium]